MLGVFWNPQDEQISKLSLDMYSEQHLKEILRFFPAAGAVCHHCILKVTTDRLTDMTRPRGATAPKNIFYINGGILLSQTLIGTS